MLIYNQLRRLKTLLVNIKRFYWSISPKGFVPNINFDYVEKQKKFCYLILLVLFHMIILLFYIIQIQEKLLNL